MRTRTISSAQSSRNCDSRQQVDELRHFGDDGAIPQNPAVAQSFGRDEPCSGPRFHECGSLAPERVAVVPIVYHEKWRLHFLRRLLERIVTPLAQEAFLDA